MVTDVHLGFNELRGLVIATQRYGSGVAEKGGTFSEGHAGHEFEALARKVDGLVCDSEPEHHFLIVHESEILEDKLAVELALSTLRSALSEEMEKTRKLTDFIDQIRVKLRVVGLPMDAIFGMIITMQQDIERYEQASENEKASQHNQKALNNLKRKSIKKSAKKKK